MGASDFVGRVGGLALALGVGAAMFSGSAVAWADRGGDGGGSSGNDSGSSSSAPHRGSGSTAPRAAAATPTRGQDSVVAPVVLPDVQAKNASPAAVAAVAPAPVAATVVAPAASEPEAIVDPEPSPAPEPVAPEPTGDPTSTDPVIATDDFSWIRTGTIEYTHSDLIDPVVIVDPVQSGPDPVEPGDMTAVAYDTGDDGANGAGTDPSGPVDSAPTDLVLASFIRRETTAAAAATDSPSALVTTSDPGSAKATSGLTANPVTTYFDGVLQGNLNVTSASGCGLVGNACTLSYSVTGSSAGGKATLNNVPTALPGGGAGSYTLLPYATWINPSNPTKFPTPSGTQDFTVRVSENTMFDQAITGIPLVGIIAQPIINLLQQTPFIGNLLAPLIGSSINQTISVNLNQLVPAGKQVAYTYKVTSFDGTLISTNFFPASAPSLLPALGNQQATIFNGPGLGGAGTTDPYASSGAAGSVPGLALMRGQGLPGPLATAPLGFNVITWDPRGEWDSGGILQLDSPFYEGRDVSSLIDWANANTPLLNETPGKPDVAMMGGSYGGGIQLTTVDPRIKSIVPSIAWNSLITSLRPGRIFKSAWANNLAEALLLTGASSINRINSLVTQALITGNLLGFVSETAQATFNAVGPTVLLSKLNIPTMYDQGIVDALFPLAQALDNAQTQLEQNPFFVGKADLVKMIWFCGGHGVCTTQTLQQQVAQNTVMFLENIAWVNRYTKGYLAADPTINGLLSAVAPFQWWDQKGTALASFAGMPWTNAFQNTAPIVVDQATGGRINSLTSKTGPLTEKDAAGAVCGAGAGFACQFPLNQVFATKAKNAVNVDIPIAPTAGYIVGAPKVSFTYSGFGNAKAVYAQIVDNATGQVLGNINTPVPVILDGKEHTVDAFPIANIAYTPTSTISTGCPQCAAPVPSLTLQLVANSSLYENPFWSVGVDINKIRVSLPTTSTAIPNPVPGLIPA